MNGGIGSTIAMLFKTSWRGIDIYNFMDVPNVPYRIRQSISNHQRGRISSLELSVVESI
jgi:hypothetical protein